MQKKEKKKEKTTSGKQNISCLTLVSWHSLKAIFESDSEIQEEAF